MQRGFILYRYSLFSPAGAARAVPPHKRGRPFGSGRPSAGSRTARPARGTVRAGRHPVVVAHTRASGRTGLAADEHPLRSAGRDKGDRLIRSSSGSRSDLSCAGSAAKGSAAAARRRGGGSRRCSRDVDVFVAVAPVGGQSLRKAQNALGDDEKRKLRPRADHPPRRRPPDVRLLQKEIGGKSR